MLYNKESAPNCPNLFPKFQLRLWAGGRNDLLWRWPTRSGRTLGRELQLRMQTESNAPRSGSK